ncbi:hypothetical protein BB776_00810 [Planococcus salinarum]|uniref:Anti-sigma factor n=1 Tax=Planococcus salinarum TaxID=622695 RepID=A0ABX3D059_9BACL|nr:hypothetical protein [Planococcus salinarum]OHX51155.1 hypothetical protein BB776_00810 [Planococcus salinarum]TAA69246.1 hypothetical protein D2909_13125 [Planococcus salinarum]
MSQQNDFDPLFEEMKSAELSESAKRDTLAGLHNKLSRKRQHFIPTVVSGLAAVAVIVFLVLFASNSSMFENISSGGGGEDQLVFAGAGENWEIEYVVMYQEGEREKDVATLTYIGDGNPPETIDYEVGSSSGTNNSLNEENSLVITSQGKGLKLHESQENEAVIRWEGKSETFLLTRK